MERYLVVVDTLVSKSTLMLLIDTKASTLSDPTSAEYFNDVNQGYQTF